MKRRQRYALCSMLLGLVVLVAPQISAQTTQSTRHTSFALETDGVAYSMGGFSAIVNLSLRNGLQFALGTGRYEVPSFYLEGNPRLDSGWTATATSAHVLRVSYRFKGAMSSGPAVGAVAMLGNWRLRSASLPDAETKFQPLNVGITAGYYQHFGKHLYVYPMVAFTYNKAYSGSTSVRNVAYEVERFKPHGSLHVGWEWAR